MTLRFAAGSDDVIEGWLVPFGGSFNGRDSYGTYATRATDFCLDWFPNGRPLLYHHGLDTEIRTTPVGRIVDLELRDAGVWMKAQLDARNEYISEIKQLVKAGALGLSSGAMGHLVEIDEATGEWKRWPLVEGSMTPTESNLLATIDRHSFASAIRSAGFEDVADEMGDNEVETPGSLRAKLDAKAKAALPDSDFAYIDSNGDRHLPINDADHVKAALARFDQTEFEDADAKAAAKKTILARAKTLGIEVSGDDAASRSAIRANAASDTVDYERSFEDIRDDISQALNPAMPFGFAASHYTAVVATYPAFVIVARYCQTSDCCDVDCSYWRIPYTLDASQEPVLGEAEPMDQVFMPAVRAAAFTTPLSLDAQQLTRHAAAVTERTKDLRDARVREGRVLSAPNREVLQRAHTAMGDAHSALGDLLERTTREADTVARAADPDTWAGQLAELELLMLTS